MNEEQPLKILQVGSGCGDWGGIERYIAYLGDSLIEQGHEVHLACPADSKLHQRSKAIHHDVAQPYLYRPTAVLPIRTLVRKEKFDLLHFHYRKDLILPAWACSLGSNAPKILTRHVPSEWNRWKSSSYLRTFKHIICVSEAVRQNLINDCHVPSNRATTVHTGNPNLDLPNLAPESGTFQVGFFGRIVPIKGLQSLIEASRKLPPGIEVLIYGSGPSEDEFKLLAEGTCVKFMGQVEDVFDAMSRVHVVAIPSTWLEAFPFSALEAMALGKAIIASEIGGLPEQVQNGKTGILHPPGDSDAIAKAIVFLSENREICRQMGEAAKSLQREQFNLRAFAERTEKVYRSVLSQGNS